MSFYPLKRKDPGGAKLAAIAGQLRELINARNTYDSTGLPCAYDNDQYDDAAADGRYEGFLDIALQLIERCVEAED